MWQVQQGFSSYPHAYQRSTGAYEGVGGESEALQCQLALQGKQKLGS